MAKKQKALKPMKLHVKKGDMVEIIAGAEKGQRGKVLRVLPKEGRVIVERLNMMKRHRKPTQNNPMGGIDEKEAPINASNVRLICPTDGKPTRAKRHVLEDGKVMRKCARTGEVFE